MCILLGEETVPEKKYVRLLAEKKILFYIGKSIRGERLSVGHHFGILKQLIFPKSHSMEG